VNCGGVIIGVDPGRRKAGYALLDQAGSVIAAGIEPIDRLEACLRKLADGRAISAIALGAGTNARPVKAALASLHVPIHLVDEYETSRAARGLYFTDHPPRGWRRLIPVGLQLPSRPIDDYAAILIGRRFLARVSGGRPPS